MKPFWKLALPGTLAIAAVAAFASAGQAQRPSPAGQQAKPQPPSQAAPAPASTQRPRGQPMEAPAGDVKDFKGAAERLGMTPEGMEAAYQAALVVNAKLNRGQFIAANMVAKSAGSKYPAV